MTATRGTARSTPPTGRANFTTGWWFTLAAFTPVVWLLAFAWLVLRTRAVTGDWPAPYRPDPKAIGGIAAIVLTGTLPLIYFVGLIAVACLLIMWIVPSLRIALRDASLHAWHIYVGFAAMMLIAILVHGNPWQLRDWLSD